MIVLKMDPLYMLICDMRRDFDFKMSVTVLFCTGKTFIEHVVLKLFQKVLHGKGDVVNLKYISKFKEAATWSVLLKKMLLKSRQKI